ncbi:MAG: type II toxin-antitoxin system PemK/MazF family toxin [Candidatus Sumerlaeota bacterium]|nr:type II toxin-antitoxin system PemK/MazF family toxin [Candidatus Sumerlaeota bacterium]
MVDLGLAAKVRPCLCLSMPTEPPDRSLATLVAHTSSPRGSRFEVKVRIRFLRLGVFDCQNLVTVPHAKLVRKRGEMPADQLGRIEAAVRRWLGF